MDLLTQSREESLNTPGRPKRSHEDHRRILEAIGSGDEVAADRRCSSTSIAVEALVLGAGATERPHRRVGPARTEPPSRDASSVDSSRSPLSDPGAAGPARSSRG